MQLKIKTNPQKTEYVLDLSIHNTDLMAKIKKDFEEIGYITDKTKYEIDMFSLSSVEKLIEITWEVCPQ